MKKVIGAVLAASLVAGMAFADVAVTLNARVRSNMYHQIKTDGGAKETYTFDLNGKKAHAGADKMSDVLGFSAKTDYAGVVLDIAANRAAKSKTTKLYSAADNVVKAKSDYTGDAAEVVTEAGQDFSFDGAYYGFLKFNALKFTFGTFDSRFVNRYNVTAGESGLLDSGSAKYGTDLLNDDSKALKDANNFSAAVAGDKTVSLVADYTIDLGDGSLLLKGALLGGEYKTDETDAENKKYTLAGYGFEGDFENDAVKVQALVKLPVEKLTIFGVYVEPKALPLPLAFGFSYGTSSNDDANATFKKGTAYAIDLRAGYQVTDEFKVSSTIKYENVKPDGVTADTALTVAAEASYVVNDLATVFADVGYYNSDLDGKSDSKITDTCCIKFRPGVVLNAGKGARVTAAVQYDNYTKVKNANATKTEVSIPVIFRVKL